MHFWVKVIYVKSTKKIPLIYGVFDGQEILHTLYKNEVFSLMYVKTHLLRSKPSEYSVNGYAINSELFLLIILKIQKR